MWRERTGWQPNLISDEHWTLRASCVVRNDNESSPFDVPLRSEWHKCAIQTFAMCAGGLTSMSEMENSIFHTVSSFVETTFRSGLTRTWGHRSHGVALVLINMLLRAKLFSLFAAVLRVYFVIMSIRRLAVILRESLFIKDSFLWFWKLLPSITSRQGASVWVPLRSLWSKRVILNVTQRKTNKHAQILWKTHRSPQSKEFAPIIHPHRQSDVVFQQGWVISYNTQCTIGSCLGIPELWNEHWNEY